MKIIKPSNSKQQGASEAGSERPIGPECQYSKSVNNAKAQATSCAQSELEYDAPTRSADFNREASKPRKETGQKKKSIIDSTIKKYSGPEFDIFADDESWGKAEYTRTRVKSKRFIKASPESVEASPVIDANSTIEILTKDVEQKKQANNLFSSAKKNKTKKLELEFQSSVPLVNGKKRRRSELENTQGPSALEQLIDPDKKEFNNVLARGMRLLAIREHSILEISNKLIMKFESLEPSIVYAVVDELVKLKYVCDDRFTESYVRGRRNKGFGPVKIKAELRGKGVSNILIQEHINDGSGGWFDNAERQYLKKYGDDPVTDYNAWTKRARFMQSRGFTMEHIHVTVPKAEFE